MESASDHEVPNRRRASIRSRTTSFLLALALEILVVIGLLTLSPHLPPPIPKEKQKIFSLSPEPNLEAKKNPSPRAVTRKKQAAGGASPAPPSPTPQAAPEATPVNPWLNEGDLFHAADISKIPTTRGNDAPGAGETGAGKDSGSAYGPGEGPGGERLYDVEWYREPTDAELSTYIPKSGAPRGSWAEIACRMVEAYHVDNCRPLGESPVGSGLARAMRLASWQFLLRPPRIGGKPLIGSWVRIRITFSKERKEDRSPPDQP
ncbi:MAG: hypothetical protein WC729_24855 [Sphingomonas sp.]|jgi:protein TonB|uniref:hypothetical protein n=1 Tax=Sphingomonas sp. TaxID=28214 RepID=UPI0035662EDC